LPKGMGMPRRSDSVGTRSIWFTDRLRTGSWSSSLSRSHWDQNVTSSRRSFGHDGRWPTHPVMSHGAV
jgi:hypothetical protein